MKKTNRILILLIMLLGFTHPQTLSTHASMSVRHQTRNWRTHHLNLINSHADAMNDDWVIECVDCPKRFTEFTNRYLQLDSEDHPHIAYGGDHLYYAWNDGTEWRYEMVDIGGSAASLVLDADDNPHISYIAEGLKYATRKEGSWEIHTVINLEDRILTTSIDLDPKGYPHIAYITTWLENYQNVSSVHYAFQDSGGWHFETLDTYNDYVESISHRVDSQGNTHLTYGTWDSLIYAYHDSSGWEYKILDDEGFYASLVLDSQDFPHIGYVDSRDYYPGPRLRYAYKDASGWTNQEVSSGSTVSQVTKISLALDKLNHPFLSFTQEETYNLILVYRETESWLTQIIDSSGARPSLALDADGRPHISYQKYSSYAQPALNYAHLGTYGWDIQKVDMADNSYISSNALALDENGNAHISYSRPESLIYAYQDDSEWEFEIVDNLPYDGISSLTLDSKGNPHISYYNEQAKYASRSQYGWQIEVIDCITTSNNVKTSLDLDDNDTVHVIFSAGGGSHEDPVGELEYAYRISGEWHCETVYDNATWDASMKVSDDGVAFVSFMDWVYLTLNLATRTQSGWITQFVDGPTSGDTSIDLDVEGNAHIIYHDSVEGLIKYAYQDNSGWKTDVIDQVGEYYPETSIALDQTDKPNISYSKDDGLYYAYLKDGAWNLELVDSYADRNSITLDNAGKPHISYTAVNHLMHAYLGTPPCTTPLCTFEYWGYGRLRDTVPYSLQVINTSSLTETFDISTEGYQWPISAPSTIGPLTFGESTSLHVQVTIPPTATLGSSDTATITLTSQNDPSVTTTATLTTYAAITTYLPRVSK